MDELKQLSLSALRHAELVNLARDHGPEALEAFIMEHVRPNGSEHAQGDDEMKFEVMYPEDVCNVMFTHTVDGPNGPGTLYLRHFTGDGHRDLSLREEIDRFQLDEAQTKVLVRRVLQAMLDRWVNPKVGQFYYGSMWGSALLAARTYLDDHELLKKLLLAAVVYRGGHSKDPVGLLVAVVPQEKLAKIEQTSEDQNRLSGLMPNKALQLVINYLLESGCTEEEVRTAWAEMLRTRQRDCFKTVCITEWWKGLKVGEGDLKKEAEPIACQLLLHEFNNILVKGCFDWNDPRYSQNGRAPEDFMKVIDFLLSQTDFNWRNRNKETKKLVRDYFVRCVARGKLGTAHYMLVRYGRCFDLWSVRVGRPDENLDTAMERLMRAAIEEAEKSRSYGIATALAEYSGGIGQLNP